MWTDADHIPDPGASHAADDAYDEPLPQLFVGLDHAGKHLHQGTPAGGWALICLVSSGKLIFSIRFNIKDVQHVY